MCAANFYKLGFLFLTSTGDTVFFITSVMQMCFIDFFFFPLKNNLNYFNYIIHNSMSSFKQKRRIVMCYEPERGLDEIRLHFLVALSK